MEFAPRTFFEAAYNALVNERMDVVADQKTLEEAIVDIVGTSANSIVKMSCMISKDEASVYIALDALIDDMKKMIPPMWAERKRVEAERAGQDKRDD